MTLATQPPTTQPLTTHAVSKRYGGRFRKGRWALKDVDLELPEGSVTALVGPNDAGRTTLIRICMAFERPSSGSVEVEGVDPWKHRAAALRRVGYVPRRRPCIGACPSRIIWRWRAASTRASTRRKPGGASISSASL